MKDETYNGWKNVETWRLYVLLTNDEQHYNKTKGMSGNALRRYVRHMQDYCPDGIIDAIDFEDVSRYLRFG